MHKHVEIARALEKRIEFGDYAIMKIPSERVLADEMNVSHMTARKAVQLLIENRVLQRAPNGRLEVNRKGEKGDRARSCIACIAPSYPSMDFHLWHMAIEKAAAGYGIRTRPIHFVHWDDPVLSEALDNFDGIFLVPDAEPMPNGMMQRLSRAKSPIVIIGTDWTDRGFVSIVPTSASCLDLIMGHLQELGHRSIDCFNTQPLDDQNHAGIKRWEYWRRKHNVTGRLINDPVAPYSSAREHAYHVASKLVSNGQWNTTAVYCTTIEVAIGIARVFHENGKKIGRDVSICTVNGEGVAQRLIPSITCIQPVELGPLVSVCMEWIIRGGHDALWVGPRLIEPSAIRIFLGESTGPSPRR